MRIKKIHLKNYKRFTDLTISEIPKQANLVVLVGPNGSGKSSVFDSFLAKTQAEINNFPLTDHLEQYYEKVPQAQSIFEISNNIGIEFHEDENANYRSSFHVRSAYRNESDFRIDHLQTSRQTEERPRLTRIIDIDTAVSENYTRLALQGLQDLYHASPGSQMFDNYRKEKLGELQNALGNLFSNPELLLQGTSQNL